MPEKFDLGIDVFQLEGELRTGVGGGGYFNSPRPANKSGRNNATDFSFGPKGVKKSK